MADIILYNIEDRIGIITVNNPPANSINNDFMYQLEATLAELEQAEVLAVVIKSDNPKVFVAGADINQFVAWQGDDGVKSVTLGNNVFKKIANFPSPVICAVNGFAFGGGLELALACDIRVFAANAKVGVPETTLGIFPGYAGTQRLPRLVGVGMAKKMLFTGAPVTATEAYRIGLCEELVDEGQAFDKAMELARLIAKNGPLAVRQAKKVMNEGIELDINAAIDLEIEYFATVCNSEDKTEGAKAFLEKRKPVFKGK